jgi:hypothetical protein
MTSSLEANSTEHATVRPFSAPVALLPLRPFCAPVSSVYEVLVGGGRIMVRDFIMDPLRTSPVGGTLFAINMLVGTSAGGTYTLDELREDLMSAGFVDITMPLRSDTMNSVLAARKA